MTKPDYSIEVDDEGELTLVTRTNLGHIVNVDHDDLPECCWENYRVELDSYNDGQSAAFGVRDAAKAAYNGSRGDFGGRVAG